MLMTTLVFDATYDALGFYGRHVGTYYPATPEIPEDAGYRIMGRLAADGMTLDTTAYAYCHDYTFTIRR